MPDASTNPADQRTAAANRLVLDGIRKEFGKTVAVASVSLTVAEGEIVCLLGPSGCGKSTTLRIAAGAERPDAGQVTIGGALVAGPGVFVPPERRSVGLVFQDYALFPHLTVKANVGFGLHRLAGSERARRVAAALERVRLPHLARAYPHELSGGEQQRVALARALAPEPQLMLMDEPFSGLDRELRGHVREESIRLLRELGTATLLVTHDPQEALQIADRIVLLRKGHLIQDATPETIWRRPADAGVASFLGEVNTLEATARGGLVATPFGDIRRPLKDGPVTTLIRPEDVAVAATGTVGPELTVLAAKFLGAAYVIDGTIASAGAPVAFRARLALPAPPEPGARIRLACDLDSMLVFSGVS